MYQMDFSEEQRKAPRSQSESLATTMDLTQLGPIAMLELSSTLNTKPKQDTPPMASPLLTSTTPELIHSAPANKDPL